MREEERKRTRQLLTMEQTKVLNKIWAKTRFPSTSVRESTARELGITPRKVQVSSTEEIVKSSIGAQLTLLSLRRSLPFAGLVSESSSKGEEKGSHGSSWTDGTC